VELALAALLHDVATPPFAHTAEYVLEAFDHEIESQNLLAGRSSDGSSVSSAVFASQIPQFRSTCGLVSKVLGTDIDPDRVAEFVVGDGDLGFLVHGSVDLDNADNVTRACRYLGLDVSAAVPLWISDWLATLGAAPSDLERIPEPLLAEWLRYRSDLYGKFFESSDAELGRQAFLQHLMRRGLDAGMSREELVWNTDERLLLQFEQLDEPHNQIGVPSLRELTQRYRLLESPTKIAHVELFDHSSLKSIGSPQAVSWIERQLATPFFQPIVSVARARHGKVTGSSHLFPPPPGVLIVFKLGAPPRELQLPSWLRGGLGGVIPRDYLVSSGEMSRRLAQKVAEWVTSRPWTNNSEPRKRCVLSNLRNFGDWSFRLSRNDSLHTYPGTFVHAIPAALIASLGVQGELVIDPFGGTGQTAVEAIRQGCDAISGDVNYVARLIASARLTYLASSARMRIRGISRKDLLNENPAAVPEFALRDKWFHRKTLSELSMIKSYIDRRRDPSTRQFLLAALSAVITACTGRRGKEHGYFADNTPLERGVDSPPYQDAIDEFLVRISHNLRIVERLYVQIERSGSDPESVLAKAAVVRADVNTASASSYGIAPHSAGAIVTSPPYLCMADYTLGQRLSYELLCPGEMDIDFMSEIGRRRQRFQSDRALNDYVIAMQRFAKLSASLLRVGGYVATVLGTPTAKKFQEWDATQELDDSLELNGFEKMWEVRRPINWHRNHGYARLTHERIAVHVLRSV
jgi:hypothetical protein